ncbi:MAG TPA: DUF2304 domain-containing protein, partial [Vicinamibacterales bacterium]|nr:DUF2304 domain-containing protein [Vicinamibacterales bacterium]
MTDLVHVMSGGVSVLLLAGVLELVRRRKLTEEYSVIWIVCAGALLVLSLWPAVLHTAAEMLGVHYPPALLLLPLILFGFVASLHFSVVISRQRRQIERLVEEVALLDADLRALGGSRRAVASEQMVPGATGDGREAAQQRHV